MSAHGPDDAGGGGHGPATRRGTTVRPARWAAIALVALFLSACGLRQEIRASGGVGVWLEHELGAVGRLERHDREPPFKEALLGDGIPFTSFAVDDVHAEYERRRALGVRFTQEPTQMGPVTTTVVDDTCGNLIQIAPMG